MVDVINLVPHNETDQSGRNCKQWCIMWTVSRFFMLTGLFLSLF